MLIVSDVAPVPVMFAMMLPPPVAVVFFALWAVILVLSIGVWRTSKVLTGQAKANGFTPGTPHGSDMYWRLNRAHVNTLENLPIFASLVFACLALGQQSPYVQLAANIAVWARVVQSLIHVASGSPLAVTCRFAAYAVQLAAFITIGVLAIQASS